MLGVLCARHKPWILASLSLAQTCPAALTNRISGSEIRLVGAVQPLRHHSSSCRIAGGGGGGGGAASIWHAILPTGGIGRRPALHSMRGEGSWNVAWDARPARWLHRPDSAWLLFGVCACIAAPLDWADVSPEAVAVADSENGKGCGTDIIIAETNHENVPKYRVTAVTADGRCLFRAIAHVACMRNGEEAPDESRQGELADELRAHVVNELLRRRKETEWFIEEDFDAYVNRIRQPYVWGGEPELLMASHVLKTPITVFMIDRNSSSLIKIADYGEEYQKEKESPITILFHGYGHYDILEVVSDQTCHKIEA